MVEWDWKDALSLGRTGVWLPIRRPLRVDPHLPEQRRHWTACLGHDPPSTPVRCTYTAPAGRLRQEIRSAGTRGLRWTHPSWPRRQVGHFQLATHWIHRSRTGAEDDQWCWSTYWGWTETRTRDASWRGYGWTQRYTRPSMKIIFNIKI